MLVVDGISGLLSVAVQWNTCTYVVACDKYAARTSLVYVLDYTYTSNVNDYDILMKVSVSRIMCQHIVTLAANLCCLHICDWAYENWPCEHKLHQVIFSLITFIENVVSHFHKLQKKAH